MRKDNITQYIQPPLAEGPNWRKFVVESNLPESLEPLRELSRNLWWVWNQQARDLFQSVDPLVWEEVLHNPILLLERVNYNRLLELSKDKPFMKKMIETHADLQNYLAARKSPVAPKIAYFSMEYGLHDSLKIFSGGLGVLAGDYLKEASDANIDLIGVGLLYRYGYFKQTIDTEGNQINNYIAERFSKIPVQPAYDAEGNWVEVTVEFPNRQVMAKVWQANVGAIKLYLMETDHDVNDERDRSITHNLYGGDNENRLKQEMLLGIGGIRALKKLGYQSDIYHCNEGHAALIGIERIARYIANEKLSFAEASEVVKSSTLFTTHTPVPAGHDSFHNDLFKAYMHPYASRVGLEWEEFINLGKTHPDEDHFNMSYLASNLSHGINGVSKLHGDVSKGVLKHLYRGYMEEEIDIGYVTNGVHYPTWTAKEWKELHLEFFGSDFASNLLDFDRWKKIYDVPSERIWKLRQDLRLKTIQYIRQRFSDVWIKRHENPKLVNEIMGKLNPEALTIGFARRFATYKRAHLLFRDLERLSEIVNNPLKPVQFIFAGKAHPADKMGQDLIKHIVAISKMPEFRGKVLFVQNYDMNLAKMLLQGVDVWLNTPTRPLEASGTSGEKGVMNGTLHFSVLDGWWVEGYQKDAGWALPQERTFDVQDLQDELDAATIYDILEKEIIESFFDRNKQGIPERWVTYIKNNIAEVAPHFTTSRMIRDYSDRFYHPLQKRSRLVKENDFKVARELSAWKEQVSSLWENIEVKEIQIADGVTNLMHIGEDHPARVVVDLKGLAREDVGLELLVTTNGNQVPVKLIQKLEFETESFENGVATFALNVHLQNAGTFSYGLRLFPKNHQLGHRQDFRYVKWI